MKHYLLLICLLFSSNCFAQEIQSDTEENGIRRIATGFITDGDILYTGTWAYAVQATKSKTLGTNYTMGLVITGVNKDLLPEKPGILVRFFNDDEVLRLNAVSVMDIYHKDCAAMIVLTITEQQLARFKNGLTKIRVETKNNYVQHEYEQDECGALIYQAYANIKQRFSQPRKTFADGF